MRAVSLLLAIGCTCAVLSQNWALINPAYKYNYSNDGTDTISNQIFVTHIDTLGPDSFRYELNRIARVCDTCTTPGMFLLVDQPQFMLRKVIAGPTVWHFVDPGSLVLLPHANVGEVWMYDTLASITATMGAEETVQVFGNDVLQKVIDLSNGDSIVICEPYGLLRWNDHDLIGEHGPNVGALVPSPGEMFPYQAGDVLEYAINAGGMDGFSSNFGHARRYKFTVQSGDVVNGTMTFNGSMVDHRWNWVSYWGGPNNVTSDHQTLIGDTWTAGRPELPWADLLTSYPGQLIGHRNDVEWWTDSLLCIARHGIDTQGRFTIGCEALADPTQSDLVGNFIHAPDVPWSSAAPVPFFTQDHCPSGPNGECGVLYTAGTGLNWLYGGYFESWEQYVLAGALLSGDTIGTVHSDDYIITLSVNALEAGPIIISPNPASAQIRLRMMRSGSTVRITDADGRLVASHPLVSGDDLIDVQHLHAGAYMLLIDGLRPQRLMIVR